MSKKMMRSVLAVLLALMMLVVFVACGDPADTTTPDTTDIPEVTEPEVTEPEVTEPEVTEPEVTEPEGTLPEETLPEETLPEETLPAETEPEETKPAETTPPETTAPDVAHKHEYSVVIGVATCLADGNVQYICSCGDMYEEAGLPAYGHEWVVLVETIPATCTSTGLGYCQCSICGWEELRELPMLPHDLSISTAIVPAKDDLLYGKGYEMLACADCNYMEQVVANHPSGHHFVTNPDNTATCGCGTLAVDFTVIGAFKNDYSGAEDNNMAFGSAKSLDGKWWVSGFNGQSAYFGNADFKGLLGGNHKGDSVVGSTLTFKLSYTGTVPATYGGSFFSWRSQPGLNGAAYNEEFGINLNGSNGKLVLSRSSVSVTLEKDVEYTLTFNMDPENSTISMTVSAPGMDPVSFFSNLKTKIPVENMWAIYVSRDKFYCADSSAFALWIDDVSVDYVARNPDETNMNVDACEHEFESEPEVSTEHPLFQRWSKETCKNCGRYYYKQDCMALGGHRWGENPISATESTCSVAGVEVYKCELCEATTEVTLALAHGLVNFEGRVAATDDPLGVGYELWSCDCGLVQKVEATHESGHNFIEQPSGNGLCRCGAENVAGAKNLGTHTFDSTTGTLTIDGLTNAYITEDGKLNVGKKNHYHWMYTAKTAGLAEAFTGELNGLTVSQITYTLDFSYTGNFAGGGDYFFMAGNSENGQTHQMVNVSSDSEGRFIFTRNKTVTLEKDTVYKMTIEFDLATDRVSLYIEGDDLEKTTLYTQTKPDFDLAKTSWVRFSSHSNRYNSTDGAWEIYMDNFSVDCVALGVDESAAAVPACAHDFEAIPVVDYLHPEHGYWRRETCKDCGIYYYRVGCEYAGHAWTAEPIEGDIGNCLTASYAIYECTVCGETNTITADKGPHSYTIYVSTTAAADGAVGYESWKCDLCGEIINYQSEHASGHVFDAVTKECACGALAETLTNVLHPITDEIVLSSYNSQPSWLIEDGAWSGTYDGKAVDHIRVSMKFRYTGIASECDSSSKADTLASLRLDGGATQFVNIRGDLSGDKVKLSVTNEAVLEAGVEYILAFDCDLTTGKVVTWIGTEGQEPVILCEKTSTILAKTWRLYFRTMNVGYSNDTETFAMYIADFRVDIVEDIVDTSNMLAPAPVE